MDFNQTCALILRRSDLGLLMGKFCQLLTELSASEMSYFLFLDDNFSRYQCQTVSIFFLFLNKNIWAMPSENVSTSMRKMHRLGFILGMPKVSFGYLLSMDTHSVVSNDYVSG